MTIEGWAPIDYIEALLEGEEPPMADLKVSVLMLHTAFRDLSYGLSCLADVTDREPKQQVFDDLMRTASVWLATLDDAPLRLIDQRPTIGA